ncbi:hypothetical protein ACU61A_25570 [Pseudonocardia sichuanensis]
MTASYAPEDLLSVVPTIRSGVEEAAGLVNGIISGVDSVLRELPPELVGGVRDGVAEVRRLFEDVIGQLRRALDEAGDPAALRAAGEAWVGEIGGVASNLSALAVEGSTQAAHHWTGPAAEAYHRALRPQYLALDAVKTTGYAIDTVLNALARAVVEFWMDIEVALIALLIGLAAAALPAVVPLTTAAAIAAAAASLIAFGTAVNSAITMFTDLANETSVRTAELGRRVHDGTGFVQGSWPVSAAEEFSDASLTDGDPTEWNLR